MKINIKCTYIHTYTYIVYMYNAHVRSRHYYIQQLKEQYKDAIFIFSPFNVLSLYFYLFLISFVSEYVISYKDRRLKAIWVISSLTKPMVFNIVIRIK